MPLSPKELVWICQALLLSVFLNIMLVIAVVALFLDRLKEKKDD